MYLQVFFNREKMKFLRRWIIDIVRLLILGKSAAAEHYKIL